MNHPLQPFLPEAALPKVIELLQEQPVHFTVAQNRHTKWGDYRPPSKAGERHRLSVNGTLPPQAFLLTLLHEYAHLKVHIMYKNRVEPHGNEWKKCFQDVCSPFLNEQYFQPQVLKILIPHMQNPKASASADAALFKVLLELDQKSGSLVGDMKVGWLFELENGFKFVMEKQGKKRSLCARWPDGRKFKVFNLAKVLAFQESIPA